MRTHSGLQRLLGAMIALTLMLGGAHAGAAQTPEATPLAAGSGPVLGDGVLLHAPSGREVAQFAILQVADPYEGAEAAERGYHWVGIEILVQNLGSADFWLRGEDVRLIDSNGINNVPAIPVRDVEEAFARPDLPYTLFDPVPVGESGGGWLFYEVIDGATPRHIIYSSSYAHELVFLVLANLDGEIAAEGDATAISATDGSPAGSITVDEIVPDFAAIDPELEVSRGRTQLAIVVTITNDTDAELDLTSSRIDVVDELGYLYSQDAVLRGEASTTDYPNFSTFPLAAGESRPGALFFELPPEASLAYVLYRSGQSFEDLVIVAQRGDGSARSGDVFTPQDSVAAGISAECVGVAEWVEDTGLSFLILLDPFDALEGGIAETDPDELRDLADLVASARKLQGAVETPAIAQDAQQAFLTLFETFEKSFDDIADRLEAGEDPAAIEADVSDPEGEFLAAITAAEEAVATLEAACPESNVDDL